MRTIPKETYDQEGTDSVLYSSEHNTKTFDLSWKQVPSLQELQAELATAEPSNQEQITKIASYKAITDNLWSTSKPPPKVNMSKVRPKVVKKLRNWRASSLTAALLKEPNLFTFSGRSAGDSEWVAQEEKVINYQMNNNRPVRFVDKLVNILTTEGSVVIKTGWILQPKGDTENPISAPTYTPMSSENILIDPTSEGDISKATFVGHRYTASLIDLQSSGNYKNLEALQKRLSSAEEESTSSTMVLKKLNDTIDYWGLWDTQGDGLLHPIVATWVGDDLIRLDDSPYPFSEAPFDVINYEQASGMFGVPDAEDLSDSQEVIGALTRGVLNVMARASNGQQGLRSGFVAGAQKVKFHNGENYEFNGQYSAEQGIHTHKFETIPESAVMLLRSEEDKMEALTGIKSFGAGISGDSYGNSTAVGVKNAVDSASKREMNILRRIGEGLTGVARKTLQLNNIMLSSEQVSAITGKPHVIAENPNQVLLDVEIHLSTEESNQVKAAGLELTLQTGAASMHPDIARLVQARIAELRGQHDFAETFRNFEPTPDPAAQKLQEIAIAQAEAELANELAKTAENEADTRLKIGKAKLVEAQARVTNEEFLDKTSGAFAERHLQKEEDQHKNALELQGTSTPAQEVPDV